MKIICIANEYHFMCGLDKVILYAITEKDFHQFIWKLS
jgi:hypothetical protein